VHPLGDTVEAGGRSGPRPRPLARRPPWR